jgi:hypothetical protein
MIGLSKSQMKHDMEFRIHTTLMSFSKYEDLRQVLDRVVECVADTIEKNNFEIEKELKNLENRMSR